MTAILKRLKKEEKGFTLIELLAVIVILGIIAAIAVPLIGNILSSNREKADFQTARQIYDAARLYVTSEQNGDFKSTTGLSIPIAEKSGDSLQSKGYLDKSISLPSTKAAITGGEVKFTSEGQLSYVSITTDEGSTPAMKYYLGADVLKGEGKATTNKPSSE